jgi:hypothetical protein
MSKPFGSFLSRCVRLYPRLTFRAASRTECRIRAYCSGTRARRLLSKSVSILPFACMSVILLGNNSCDGHTASPIEQKFMDLVLFLVEGDPNQFGNEFRGVSKALAAAPSSPGRMAPRRERRVSRATSPRSRDPRKASSCSPG